MKYFQVKARHDDFVVGSPTDSQGEPVTFEHVQSVREVQCTFIDASGRLEQLRSRDCFKCASCLAVSPRAAHALRQLRLPDSCDFVNATVVGREAEFLPQVAFLLATVERPDIADMGRSKFKAFDDGSVWYFTEPVVLDALVRDFDLMVSLDLAEVCSELVVNLVAQLRLSGFRFEACGRS